MSVFFTALLAGAVSFVARPGAVRPPGHTRCVSCWAAVTERVITVPDEPFDPVPPSAFPTFVLQGRVVEPDDVASVPAALNELSVKFPGKEYVVEYRSDTGYLAAKEDAPVLDLSDLKEITFAAGCNSIKLDAGATVAGLVKKLSNVDQSQSQLSEMFAVLPGDDKLSIVEAVLDKADLTLRDAVKELHVVDRAGRITSRSLDTIKVGEDIIVSVILATPKPSKLRAAAGQAVARWYLRLPTAPMVTERIFAALPDAATIMIFKCGRNNPQPSVVVFVDGDEVLDLPDGEWEVTTARTPEELWHRKHELVETASLDALTASAVWAPPDGNLPSIAEVLQVFPRRQQHLMVKINKGKVRVLYDAKNPPEVDKATCKLFSPEVMTDRYIAPAAKSAARMETRTISSFDTGKVLQDAVRRVVFGLRTTRALRNAITRIEGFKGEIFSGKRLAEKRQQYATSSFDREMNPAIIAYPTDEEDVALAIQYATKPEFAEKRKTQARPSGRPLKVMGRSGGHQYCGVSCDNDALILSMDNFNMLEIRDVRLEGVTGPDGNPHTVTKEVHVGTGIRLEALAEFFNTDPATGEAATGENQNFGVTVPHGECPGVGIGGHSQTGGFGHMLRNFGLCIDYVYGFTIVTADGAIRQVNRDSSEQADKDLYWAVLGGSPGAFGVTTHLVFHPLLDKDYPHSTGWSAALRYTESRMRNLLEVLEDFTNSAQESDDNAMAEGLDLMMSLSTNPTLADNFVDKFVPSIILVEMVCRDKTDARAFTQMQEIIRKVEDTVPSLERIVSGLATPFDGESHYKLSEMNLGFTRKPPAVTTTGRENRRPYSKAAYGSKDKLKPGWSKAFAKLLHDVDSTNEDVHCVFQVLVGGGALQRNGKASLNSISHRGARMQSVVFDLFRGGDDDKAEAIGAAAKFQIQFEQEVVNKFQTAYPKVMAQWASHGDLDLDKQWVWEKYFDNPDTYHKLRRIKKDVDPDDVFHSRFSIRPIN